MNFSYYEPANIKLVSEPSLTSRRLPVNIASLITEEKIIAKFTRLNDSIQAAELRVIDEEGNQLGILSKREALDLARSKELDLVEVSPEAKPPVARIVDWGKYNYQRTKQQQKNRKSVKATELKQMRFGLKIGEHDLAIKMSKVDKFLTLGHKVKISIVYRGREQAHKELGFKLADKVIADFGDKVAVDQRPQLSGRMLSFVLRGTGHSKKPDQPTVKEGATNA